ncbi:MAG TPA: hypothetical protein PKW55_02785 [Spirochaetota bacterium]|nr:hypothetical protein [Spirochaetota bacterium]HOM38225.1 hypothetical protein [Spirochaetota bacterium]HPQ48557.1 hypothetical protein [Spirochaetota bacterium]
MKTKYLLIVLFLMFSKALIADFSGLNYRQRIDSEAIIDWGSLAYFGEFFTYVDIEETQNFIQESLFKSEEFVSKIRSKVLKDLLSININYEITVKDLMESNEYFLNEFTKRFYSNDIIVFSGQIGDKIKMISNIFFTGNNNIIDLILKSRYFFEDLKIKSITSDYTAYPHNGIIIEARHQEITPSLFPNIYSYDEKGNMVLIYSINHSNKQEIVKNGYVHFRTDLKEDQIEKDMFYYCAAIKTQGTKSTDVVISREDYIKFFSSPISLKKLSEGNFYIIIDPKKVKK